MTDIVGLEILLDKITADEVVKKGIAEIALRQSDAKFKAFAKGIVLPSNSTDSTLDNHLISDTLINSLIRSPKINELRGMVSQTITTSADNNAILGQLTSSAKCLSLQSHSVYRLSKTIAGISYLNVGLNAINLATSTLSMRMVKKNLDELNTKVDKILVGVDTISKNQKNDIVRVYRSLLMKFNSEYDSIQNNEVNLKSLEDVLCDMNSYMNMILDDLLDKSLDIELALEILFSLSPAYTILLREFIVRYCFTYRKIPANYESFICLFHRLLNKNYLEKVQDFYFIEKKMTFAEVSDIIGAQISIIGNSVLVLDDQKSLLNVFETKEQYELYESEVNKIASAKVMDFIPRIAEKLGMETEDLFKCNGDLVQKNRLLSLE